jgi:hypothetical protein
MTRVTRGNECEPVTSEDVKALVMVVHQGFAVSQVIRQVLRLDEARKVLLRRKDLAGGVAQERTGIEAIDILQEAAVGVQDRLQVRVPRIV